MEKRMASAVRIGVLGSGNIGGTLGAKWSAAGHDVMFGVRNASSPKAKAAMDNAGAKSKLGSIADAARFGDVVVIALPNTAVETTVSSIARELGDKIIVDTTNRFGAPVVNHIEAIRAAAPQAKIYRAFNSIGWENFANPVVEGQKADLFYCGPEGDAQGIVERLIEDIGLRPIRVGGLEAAPLVDSVGSLWVTLVNSQYRNRRMAFRLLGG
jgi:8-hydroxy-5-deazaflavin:NADPH oxidoreductase